MLLIKKSFFSKILTFIYIIIASIYVILILVVQLREIVSEESQTFIFDYSDSQVDILIFALSLCTIFLKIFAYFNLKSYTQLLEKRECYILDNQHEEFLDDLENAVSENMLLSKNNEINIKNDKEKESDIDNSLKSDNAISLINVITNTNKVKN